MNNDNDREVKVDRSGSNCIMKCAGIQGLCSLLELLFIFMLI